MLDFGVTGNQVLIITSLSLLTFGSRFLYDGKWTSTVYPNSNPNPDLKWEKKEEFNVGLDFSVLKGRLIGTIDYYVRHTKDLLSQEFTAPRINVGNIIYREMRTLFVPKSRIPNFIFCTSLLPQHFIS